MLRIKQGINLKELEKFGFIYNKDNNVWFYDFCIKCDGFGILWIKYNGELILEDVYAEAVYVFDLINKLINDGIVEKENE